MKLIIAVIRPYHLETLQKTLEAEGVFVTCVSEVVGGGREPGYKLIYREREVVVRRPKFRVELMVEEWAALEIVDLIRASTVAGCPGNVSDAKIMVLQLEDAAPVQMRPAPTRLNGTHALCAT
jgi:nitrogen regulatory protein PII